LANSFNDLSQMLNLSIVPLIQPQLISSTGTGPSPGLSQVYVGPNRINAMLLIGAVSSFTSFDCKLQASTDGTTGWTDVTYGAFNQVTAANQVPQVIPVQLPAPASVTASPYLYLRANYTLVGTSVYVALVLLSGNKFDLINATQNTPPVGN
jgi:hypothetical protein